MGDRQLPTGNGSGITLAEHARQCLEHYFAQLGEQEPKNLYELVLAEVEKPLLETVLKQAGENQTKAAKILGLSRSTLRKKLEHYRIE